MSTQQPNHADGSQDEATHETDELRRQLAVLTAENEQLRNERLRAQQVTYWRTAVGLFVLGALGIVGGFVFPEARTVLFALGGTGVFAGVLTYVLTPERFVTAQISEQLFRTIAADRDAIVDELGLRGTPVYMPGDTPRLFVPRYKSADPPQETALDEFFIIPADPTQGGVAFHPTGVGLFEELEATQSQPLAETPIPIAATLADAVVELFELADGADHRVDTETGQVTFELSGLGIGNPTATDHPVVSFFAVGLAETLETPVRVTVTDDDPVIIACSFDAHTAAEPEA